MTPSSSDKEEEKSIPLHNDDGARKNQADSNKATTISYAAAARMNTSSALMAADEAPAVESMKCNTAEKVVPSTNNEDNQQNKKETTVGDDDASISTNSAAGNAFKIPPNRKDSRKLFVGGLPSRVTNSEFFHFFSQFGLILDSIVMVDRATKQRRGFGFVTFHDPDVARKVLCCGNEGKPMPPEGFASGKVIIQDKVCEVKVSQPKRPGQNNRYSRRDSLGADNNNNSCMDNWNNNADNDGISTITTSPQAFQQHHLHQNNGYPYPAAAVSGPTDESLAHFSPINGLNGVPSGADGPPPQYYYPPAAYNPYQHVVPPPHAAPNPQSGYLHDNKMVPPEPYSPYYVPPPQGAVGNGMAYHPSYPMPYHHSPYPHPAAAPVPPMSYGGGGYDHCYNNNPAALPLQQTDNNPHSYGAPPYNGNIIQSDITPDPSDSAIQPLSAPGGDGNSVVDGGDDTK